LVLSCEDGARGLTPHGVVLAMVSIVGLIPTRWMHGTSMDTWKWGPLTLVVLSHMVSSQMPHTEQTTQP